MPSAARVDLPASVRPVGGLLAAARPLTGAWQLGVTFRKGSCLGPSGWPFCPPVDPDPKTLSGPGTAATFRPIGIVQGVACTTLSRDSAGITAGQALDVTRDWLLGRELAHAAVTTLEGVANPRLDDGTVVVAGGTGIVEALATIETEIADGMFGRLGFVHVSYANLTRLVAAQALWRDGGVWRTPAGNTVVASAGYDFTDLRATGEVYASVGEREVRADVDRAVNTTEAYAEEIGIAVFDPCFNVRVAVT